MERFVVGVVLLVSLLSALMADAAGAFSPIRHAVTDRRQEQLEALEESAMRDSRPPPPAREHNNYNTLMQLLAERDAVEADLRRAADEEAQAKALEAETLQELGQQPQKRDFRFYGSRGKKADDSWTRQLRGFNYMPSRG